MVRFKLIMDLVQIDVDGNFGANYCRVSTSQCCYGIEYKPPINVSTVNREMFAAIKVRESVKVAFC